MKVLHKLTYLGTGGIVDLRSDRELLAHYEKKLSNERKRAAAQAGHRAK